MIHKLLSRSCLVLLSFTLWLPLALPAQVTKVVVTKEENQAPQIKQQVVHEEDHEQGQASSSHSEESIYEDEEDSLWWLEIIFEIFTYFGDWGFIFGWDYLNLPFETTFTYQGQSWWQDQPSLSAWSIGLAYNLPIADMFEIEPAITVSNGKSQRLINRDGNSVKESINMNRINAQLRLIVPIDQYYVALDYTAHSLSTSITLDTNLASYQYEGYLLDNSQMSSIGLGGGWYAPEDWPIRLRLGLKGYYQWADFGTNVGMNIELTTIFKFYHDD